MVIIRKKVVILNNLYKKWGNFVMFYLKRVKLKHLTTKKTRQMWQAGQSTVIRNVFNA